MDPSTTAVVLIEFQNDFTTPGGVLHDAVKGTMDSTGMLDNTRDVVDAARVAGATVIHVPIHFAPGAVSWMPAMIARHICTLLLSLRSVKTKRDTPSRR